MTEEEKLQDYLRQNAPKKKKVEESKPEVPKPAQVKSNKAPTNWYNGKVWGEFRMIMMFGIFFPAVTLGILENNAFLNVNQAWTIGIPVISSILVFMLALTIYKLVRYSTWMNGRYYKISGWGEFFANRTPDFWKKRNYTKIRINFNLQTNASDLHREVLKTFTSKIISQWKNQYQHKYMEWIGAAPKDLKSNGDSIYGDVSQREMLWILKILNPKFIPVAKLLGTNLQDVVLKSDSKESTLFMKEEKDDAYQKHMEWVNRHDND